MQFVFGSVPRQCHRLPASGTPTARPINGPALPRSAGDPILGKGMGCHARNHVTVKMGAALTQVRQQGNSQGQEAVKQDRIVHAEYVSCQHGKRHVKDIEGKGSAGKVPD